MVAHISQRHYASILLLQGAFIFSMDHKQNPNVVDETLMHYHNEDLERKSSLLNTNLQKVLGKYLLCC